jgi:hypothetical protein
VVSDRLAVGQDLRCAGVLLGRDAAELLEQRQIDVRLDVAHRAGVAVPVPGAPEVAALLDDPDVLYARLAQPRAGEEAPEAAADHERLDLVLQRRAAEPRLDVRVLDVAREAAAHLDVLRVAVGAQPLVALRAVARAQRVGVEAEARGCRAVRVGGGSGLRHAGVRLSGKIAAQTVGGPRGSS